MPVTFAPSRAQLSVSRPKWHWKWRRRLQLDAVEAALPGDEALQVVLF